MASARKSIRQTIEEFVGSHADDHFPVDLYAEFQQQAALLHQTERVKEQLNADPFQRFREIKSHVRKLSKTLRVKDYHHVMTKSGYVLTEAVVNISKSSNETLLHFRYELETIQTDDNLSPTSVQYSIDLSKDHGPKQPLLWVQVFAVASSPSAVPAQNLDDDESAEEEPPSKQQKTKQQRKDEDKEVEADRFSAGMDPDVLKLFRNDASLSMVDDSTAFFLLMTFPFYEHEWDLVGYALEAVFGYESEDEDEKVEHTKPEDTIPRKHTVM